MLEQNRTRERTIITSLEATSSPSTPRTNKIVKSREKERERERKRKKEKEGERKKRKGDKIRESGNT